MAVLRGDSFEMSFLWSRSVSPLLDLIYPPMCACCQSMLDIGEDPAAPRLCESCLTALDFWTGACCRQCGASVGPNLEGQPKCRFCRKDRFAFSQVIALGQYKNELRRAVLAGKDVAGEPLLGQLARCLCSIREEELGKMQLDLVVPVPQHWKTRLRRSHNSSEVLATRLAADLKLPLSTHLLRKVRATPAQVLLTSTERRKNLRGAFRTRFAGRIRGRRILLVDDVLTTGSTAHVCAQTLKQAEAQEIFVAIVARGLG
jgi:ComF family protein